MGAGKSGQKHPEYVQWPDGWQETFTDIEYSCRKKKTKREEFLEIMDEIIPWDEWVGVIEPYYPKGKRGRPPMGIEKNAADVSAANLVQSV